MRFVLPIFFLGFIPPFPLPAPSFHSWRSAKQVGFLLRQENPATIRAAKFSPKQNCSLMYVCHCKESSLPNLVSIICKTKRRVLLSRIRNARIFVPADVLMLHQSSSLMKRTLITREMSSDFCAKCKVPKLVDIFGL